MQAVIDRIVDGKTAVLLVGEEERLVHWPADELPEAAKEGTWLRVEMENDTIVSMQVDEEATKSALDRVQSKLERLRQRGRGL